MCIYRVANVEICQKRNDIAIDISAEVEMLRQEGSFKRGVALFMVQDVE